MLRDPPQSMRSSKLEAPPLSRKGIEALPGQDITSMEEGMSYLESSTLTILGVPFTIETLVGALFQISMLPGIKGSCANTNAVQAVAYILAGLDTDEKASAIAEAVMDQITARLGEVGNKAVEVVQEAKEQLRGMIGNMAETMKAVTAGLAENLDKATRGISESAIKITESAVTYRDVLARPGPHGSHPVSTPTQASLLAPRVQAREGVRA